jgi:uncharacterized membrane protein (UPF0182 family)
VLKAWMNVFPGLVHAKDTMPADVLDHIRYPQDLFDVQRGLLAQYHIDNPVDAYNGKGKWAVPQDPFVTSANQPPYYVLARAPGADSNAPEFQLTSPMVVNGATNLAAYVSANSDPGPDYGKLTILQVTGQSTIYGPAQVANDLKSTAVISKDITQLDQNQSAVLHGNLLTLPLGNSFLYVEPLYVQSTGTSAFPTLQRVLVRYGNGRRIGYGQTLDDALDDLRLGREPGASINAGQLTGNGNGSSSPPTSPSSSPSPSSSSSSPPPTSIDALLTQLSAARDELNAAYDARDPVKIAQAQLKEQHLVDQLLQLQAQSSSPASPVPTH